MNSGLNNVEWVTLLVDELLAARKFYQSFFARTSDDEDKNCAEVRAGSILLNLSIFSEPPKLIVPTALDYRHSFPCGAV